MHDAMDIFRANMDEATRLLTLEQTASFLGVPPEEVYRLTATVFGGRRMRCRKPRPSRL